MWLVVVGVLLLLLFLGLVSLALFYRMRLEQCQSDPNIWCWTDWSCCGATGATGATNNLCWQGTTALYGSLGLCTIPVGATAVPPGCTCAWTNVASVPNACKHE